MRDEETAMTETTSWTTAQLRAPSTAGFLIVAVSSGAWRLPFAVPSARRSRALRDLRTLAMALAAHHDVEETTTFRGLLRPPGDDSLPGQWRGPAAYDAVLLVRTVDPAAARRLLADAETAAPGALVFAGANARRIDDVDHARPGVFLFNFFTADSVDDNLFAWQYTAGWFQRETGLDNSTVIEPVAGSTPFTLVNHCRWDGLGAVLPSLLFKSSFERFVLRTFRDHRVAPHPVLYRLDRRF
jgi:hypothetical protein